MDDAVNGERGDPALGNRQAAEANLAGQTIDGHYISGGEAAAMVDGMTASFIKVPGAWRKVDEPLALALKDCETVLGYYLIPHWDGSHFEDNIQASEGDGSPYYDYMIYHSRLAQYDNLAVLLVGDGENAASVVVFLVGDKTAPPETRNATEACEIVSSCIFLTKVPAKSLSRWDLKDDAEPQTRTRAATTSQLQAALQECSADNATALTTKKIDATFNPDYMDITLNRLMVHRGSETLPLYVFVMSAPMKRDE